MDFFSANFNLLFNFLGNRFILPNIFILIFFEQRLFNSLSTYEFNNLNKKFISFFGLFQFSAEKVYRVKYFIFFFI